MCRFEKHTLWRTAFWSERGLFLENCRSERGTLSLKWAQWNYGNSVASFVLFGTSSDLHWKASKPICLTILRFKQGLTTQLGILLSLKECIICKGPDILAELLVSESIPLPAAYNSSCDCKNLDAGPCQLASQPMKPPRTIAFNSAIWFWRDTSKYSIIRIRLEAILEWASLWTNIENYRIFAYTSLAKNQKTGKIEWDSWPRGTRCQYANSHGKTR